MRWLRQFPSGLLCLIGIVIIPASVHGQDIPCGHEISIYCADVKPGGGRLLRCLKSHTAQMTPACSQRFDEVEKLLDGTLAACQGDWVQYCFDVRFLGGAEPMMQCLRTHQAQVSPACRESLPAASHMPGQPVPGIMP